LNLHDGASSPAEGQLVYFAEHLASLHASADMAWLVGRFEFLGEKALGAPLSVLATTDERGIFRPMSSASPRTAVARDLWDALRIDDIADNAALVLAFRQVIGQSRVARFDLDQLFPAVDEVAGVSMCLIVPITYNRETIGVGMFLVEPGPTVELMARILSDHTAVAIHQLRTREEGRRLHSVDQRLWIPDEHFMLTQCRREILRARRYGRDVGIALLRLENESDIRARFGDFFTDHLLRRVGSQLAAEVRDSDILGAIDGAYAVIHTETTLAGTELSANRLRDVVTTMVAQRFPEMPEPVFTAIAVAYPESGETPEALLAKLTSRPIQDIAA
jgi:diguanylate cyclase (GGDEF)-like protein